MATERRPRPGTADEMREMWAVTQGRWESTLAQAGDLPEDVVHERVADEWSLVETLRHLVFIPRRLGRPRPPGRDGVPPAGAARAHARYPVRRFALALLTEEWEHQRYAARDLAVVSARLSGS